MKKLTTVLLGLSALICSGASSCATTPILPTLKPVDSNRYEMPFRFDCNGRDTFAIGQGFCQYREGSVMRIRIKTPDSPGEIQIRSCRHNRALDIDRDKLWQEVQWIQYKSEDSCPIVMSVATKHADVQLGKIYPYVWNDKYPPLNAKGSLYCWESEKDEEFTGQITCQYPTGIKVNGYLKVDPDKSGRYLITSSRCGLDTGAQRFEKGSAPIKWSLLTHRAEFCPVSAAVRYDDESFEEYEAYIDFFDNRYRMLPPPIMGEHEGDSYACAPQDFEFFDLNDHRKRSGLLRGKCIKDGWLNDRLSIGIAWDRAGRSSYSVYLKRGILWKMNAILGDSAYQLKMPRSPVILDPQPESAQK